MVRLFNRLSITAALLIVLHASGYGKVIINEVMANEPGSVQSLEWIELYNASSVQENLAFYEIRIGATQIVLSGSMAPGSYQIVCRRLLSSPGTEGFEAQWGNDSGVWGDTSLENYTVVEASFSLRNDSGMVLLYRVGVPESQFAWTEAGRDGFSWERTTSDQNVILQSVDYSGSTPGFVNSRTPLTNDLSLDTVIVHRVTGGADLLFTVTNAGIETQIGRRLLVYNYNPTMPDSIGSLLTTIAIPILNSGYSTDLAYTLSAVGVYRQLGATLDADDRVRNNRRLFTIPGNQYPPVVLSEIMADPAAPLTTEWVELYGSMASGTFVVSRWQLEDQANSYQISDSSFIVHAGEYVVLAQDSASFRSFYPLYQGRLIQTAHWPELNNSGDVVRLIDGYGITADSFSYASGFGSNYTWARELDSGIGIWGRSVSVGGTPGEANEIVIEPQGDRLRLTIEPQIFAPDGNGKQETCELSLEAPKASSYTLKIYDREGRVVRQFADKDEFIRPQYIWDGRSDAGNRLPIGIYICYFEATGVESIKKTVVIAR